MITVKEADRIIRSRITVMNSEKVMLENCSGRILAQEIVASFPQPSQELSPVLLALL